MSVSSVKTGATGISLLTGNAFYDPGNFTSIASTTVGVGGVASFTFSSIPSTYAHLQIRALTKSDYAGQANINMRFNSDTGSNYAWHQFLGDGSSPYSNGASSQTLIRCIHSSNETSTFGSGVIDILDYASTSKYKTVRVLSGYDMNGTGGYIMHRSGLWMNTGAISSITIIPESGNLAQYTSLALYGVKV